MSETKNEARNKFYKKGHIHILPNFNTLVVIVEKLFQNKFLIFSSFA